MVTEKCNGKKAVFYLKCCHLSSKNIKINSFECHREVRHASWFMSLISVLGSLRQEDHEFSLA